MGYPIVRKSGQFALRGEQLPNAVYTPDDVRQIRKLWAERDTTKQVYDVYREIHKQMGSKGSPLSLANIVRGRTWKHLE